MCGLCGFVDLRGTAHDPTVLRKMTDQIRHRGPDDSGEWYDLDRTVGLGHRRLSILDLSPEGHQPMLSACGRYAIVFNGEIYNYRQIRDELRAALGSIQWRGHSDTEVMLAAFTQWGVRAALERFNGMFAFALWDRRERALHLARDRLGEKPMYYGWMGDVLLFGSELKSLRAHPAWRGEIDRDALSLLMRHNYVPAPFSIYRGIKKLPPATLITFRTGLPTMRGAEPEPYWSAREVAERGTSNPLRLTDNEAIDRLDVLLRDSVAMRMEADVPLGAFLSGGIDSSAVVSLMQAQCPRPVHTFSIGFHEASHNEAAHAAEVAKHLGTNHTELYVTAQEAMAVIPRLPSLYDEPFADSSQIPTFLVSELARRHVTVALSGDGGDEFFCGYNRYFWGTKLWGSIGWLPYPMRRAFARGLGYRTPQQWNDLSVAVGRSVPALNLPPLLGDKLQKLAEVLDVPGPELLYKGLVSHWDYPENLVIDAREPLTVLTDPKRWAKVPDFLHFMMYQDMVSYLPGDILTKVDRASMGVSLEVRVPLLDHRVVEFAWSLPKAMKIRRGQGKWLLRQVLHRYVPRKLIERPKMGFGVPIDAWLRGRLRDWAESYLDERRLRTDGFFRPEPIRRKWDEHLAGTRNWQYHLWDVLMFQAWLDVERAGS